MYLWHGLYGENYYSYCSFFSITWMPLWFFLMFVIYFWSFVLLTWNENHETKKRTDFLLQKQYHKYIVTPILAYSCKTSCLCLYSFLGGLRLCSLKLAQVGLIVWDNASSRVARAHFILIPVYSSNLCTKRKTWNVAFPNELS